MSLETVSSNKAFGGHISKHKITSKALGGLSTQFNVFIPESKNDSKFPVLFYLAGLTCNEDTGAWKGGFLRDAAEAGIALVFPDTSPRGAGIANEDDDWDFGTGAGFYLDATSEKWSKHYRMRTFISEELPSVLKTATHIPLDLTRLSIMGHSMGGYGALMFHLRYPTIFRAASAFAPISNPTHAPWGIKAFNGYLSGGIAEGQNTYDPTELLGKVEQDALPGVKILVDYGAADQFYVGRQLLPENLEEAARKKGILGNQVVVRKQDGYDHSYYFISTFAPEHIRWHAKILS